jgi:hypothetical protein
MKIMQSKTLSGLVALWLTLFAGSVFAQNVTFSLVADQLKTSTGVALPTNRLLLLVADTGNNGFGFLSHGNTLNLGDIFAGDDRVIWRDNLLANATPGLYFSSTPSLALNGTWGAGDSIAVLWFETQTLASTSVSAGDRYGLFTTLTPQDGSEVWTTPGSGLRQLVFRTQDVGGFYPNSTGNANLVVLPVPEPSTTVLFGGSVLLMAFLLRRRLRVG